MATIIRTRVGTRTSAIFRPSSLLRSTPVPALARSSPSQPQPQRQTYTPTSRALSSTVHRLDSKASPPPPPPSSKDPSHPWLHYHPTPAQTHVTLSFLPTRPVPASRTVLGYLPLEGGTLESFKQESRFLDVLHDAIKTGLEQGKSQSVIYEAQTRPTDGWIHITDERAIPPAGRIGETEDLIGSVYVQEGKVVPSTYAPLPTYRLVTPNGVLALPKGLDEHLVQVLKKIDAEERGEA